MKYVLDQLSQPSTWRGLVALATAAGLKVSPDQAVAIIALGMAIAGAIGVFFPDKLKKDAP